MLRDGRLVVLLGVVQAPAGSQTRAELVASHDHEAIRTVLEALASGRREDLGC